MYRLFNYGRMITDKTRMAAYTQALDESVRPGSVVVDIGTGTGIFALYASTLGARKVYAIDPNDEIMVAKRLAQANGFSDRIDFYHDVSTRIKLPERADLIVSDLRGVLPLVSSNIPSIIDARKRFLKDGGRLIPQEDRLYVSLVNPKAVYDRIVAPWKTRAFQVNLKPALRPAVNSIQRVDLRSTHVLVEPVEWGVINYSTIQNPSVQGTVEFTIREHQKPCGLGMWFETSVLGDIRFSTSPFGPATVYGQMFFPFERPLNLAPGDQVVVRLVANYIGKEYIWQWQTVHYKGGSTRDVTTTFDQSTFYGAPLDPEKIRKQSDHWVPRLNQDGIITRDILAWMVQGKNLVEITELVLDAYPGVFHSKDEALERVKELSVKYSQ